MQCFHTRFLDVIELNWSSSMVVSSLYFSLVYRYNDNLWDFSSVNNNKKLQANCSKDDEEDGEENSLHVLLKLNGLNMFVILHFFFLFCNDNYFIGWWAHKMWELFFHSVWLVATKEHIFDLLSHKHFLSVSFLSFSLCCSLLSISMIIAYFSTSKADLLLLAWLALSRRWIAHKKSLIIK
jgi:hypothetical protein